MWRYTFHAPCESLLRISFLNTVTSNERQATSIHLLLECFISNLSGLTSKETSNCCMTGPLCGKSTGDQRIPSHNGPIVQQTFPCNDVILWRLLLYNWTPCSMMRGYIWFLFRNDTPFCVDQYVITILDKPAMGLRPSLTRFRSWPTQPDGYVVLTSLGRKGYWWGIRGLIPGCTLFSRWLIQGH